MWELRGPSLVHPGKMLVLWKSIGQPGIVVGDRETFVIFLRMGGHAIVELSLAQQLIPRVLEPVECVPGPVPGAAATRRCAEGQPGSRSQQETVDGRHSP